MQQIPRTDPPSIKVSANGFSLFFQAPISNLAMREITQRNRILCPSVVSSFHSASCPPASLFVVYGRISFLRLNIKCSLRYEI